MINPIPVKGHIPSLDGWRAIAILLVLGDHMAYSANFPHHSLSWVGEVFSGNLGVRIFFVLSGFLISLLLLRESDKCGKISLYNFYVRRVFRIFPVYFCYLAVLAVLSIFSMYADSFSSWLGCVTFSRNILGKGGSATAHFWSLAVEEQFYIIWPIIFSKLSLWKRKKTYFILLFIPIIMCPLIRAFYVCDPGGGITERLLGERSILIYADSLAVGCIGAWLAWRTPQNIKWGITETILLSFSIAIILIGRWLQISNILSVGVYAIVQSLQAWAILVCLWLTTSIQSPGFRFLNSWPIATLGLLSYSIYVWHFIFINHFMGNRFGNLLIYDWKYWVIPALLVSACSYYFLEKPMIKLGQRFRS